MESASDHQVENEKQIVFHTPDDAFSETAKAGDLASHCTFDRGRRRAYEKCTSKTDTGQGLALELSLECRKVGLDIWQFGHEMPPEGRVGAIEFTVNMYELLHLANENTRHGMKRKDFEQLIEQSLERIPLSFRDAMENLAIVVDDWPQRQMMEQMLGDPDAYIYGLFEGTPLNERHVEDSGDLPAVIHIYQAALEADFPDTEQLHQQITITLIHEIAHFMGLEEDEIDALGYG